MVISGVATHFFYSLRFLRLRCYFAEKRKKKKKKTGLHNCVFFELSGSDAKVGCGGVALRLCSGCVFVPIEFAFSLFSCSSKQVSVGGE